MIQLKMQGVIDDMILENELLAEGTGGRPKTPALIGKGTFNEVSEQQFTNMVEGSKVTYVLKPIEAANKGFGRSPAANYIYKNLTRNPATGQRTPNAIANNICAHKGANALGCGHVIVQSGVTFTKERNNKTGTYVLAMEKAPGTTLSDVRTGKSQEVTIVRFAPKSLLDQNGLPLDGLPLQKAFEFLEPNARKNAEDELMMLCNDLEWADFLSGQADRHMKNVLFGAELYVKSGDSNSFTYELRGMTLKGIDNDISFPINDFKPLNIDAMTDKGKTLRMNGINSARLPVFVTSALLEKLEYYAKNPNEFIKDVRADLPMEDQKIALLGRLEAMLKHAKELEKNGLVVHDGTSKDPGRTLSDLRKTIRNKLEQIARDLEVKITVDEDEAKRSLLHDWMNKNRDKIQNRKVTKEEKDQIMSNFSRAQIDQKTNDLKARSVRAVLPIFARIMNLDNVEQKPEGGHNSAVDSATKKAAN